jgi:hypothetical protein
MVRISPHAQISCASRRRLARWLVAEQNQRIFRRRYQCPSLRKSGELRTHATQTHDRGKRVGGYPDDDDRRSRPLAASADALELGIQQLVAVLGRCLHVPAVAMPAPSSQMLVADIAPAISTAAPRICGSCQRDQNQRAAQGNQRGRSHRWGFPKLFGFMFQGHCGVFRESARSIATFGVRQADDRQRGGVVRLFGVAAAQ